MKQLLLIAALIMGAAFGQLRYNAKAFYGDILISSQKSNMTLLGTLPGGAILTAIYFGYSVTPTNAAALTNWLDVGIKTQTNYFLPKTQIPGYGSFTRMTTTMSNGLRILSATDPTPIYGYISLTGVTADTSAGAARVCIEYIQK